MLFRVTRISHSAAVMVLDLAFYTKDTDRVGDAVNMILLPELPPSEGFEAALLERWWDAILGGGTLTYFANTSLLLGQKKATPVVTWYKSTSQIEDWYLFCMVFLIYIS